MRWLTAPLTLPAADPECCAAGAGSAALRCQVAESLEAAERRYQRQMRDGVGHDAARSDFAAVVSPLQQSLPLPRPAGEMARLAVPLDLPDVPAHRLPPPDLPPI